MRKTATASTTASVQDYLAAIYDLAGSGAPVIGARLAKHMSISAPAVTEAMPRLGPPTVNPQKHPVVVRHHVVSKMPKAVVFIRAIARLISGKRKGLLNCGAHFHP
jgi:hypothetical protein